MTEEQEEKWYNSFTREQLIGRCKYLQRSCERKEDSIRELEMENADLENIIKEAIEYIETHQLNVKKGITTFGSERLSMEERKLLDILEGEDKNDK